MNEQEYFESLKLAVETAQAVAQTCLKAIELKQAEADQNKWITLESAAAALGGISVGMLKDRCDDGRFKHGIHFINTSDGRRGNYFVKVSAVRKFFETDPAKRSPVKSPPVN